MTVDKRATLVKLMQSTLADESAHQDWTYDEVRPMPVPSKPWVAGMKVRGDCSKGVQFLSWWNGDPDPMDESYDSWGNSYTLWLRLQHLDTPSELQVGDVVTFGTDGDQHATRVLEAGADPLLWSFGHQGAPDTYNLSQDGRPAQYLRVPLPTYVPTPVARLKARTGWFAWVAWKLGEGDWQDYPGSDKAVRPNVPKRIPLSWWKRYAKFLLKRKKGNPATK